VINVVYLGEANDAVRGRLRRLFPGMALSVMALPRVDEQARQLAQATLVCVAGGDACHPALALLRERYPGLPVLILPEAVGQAGRQASFCCALRVLETLPLAVFYTDLNGVCRGCNQACCQMLGCARKQPHGRMQHEWMPESLQARHRQADEALLSHGGTSVFEARMVDADGHTRVMEFHKSLLRVSGQPLGIVCVMLDVTGRAQIQQTLQQEQALLHAVVDVIPDLLYFKDTDGAYLGCNRAFRRFYQLPPEVIRDLAPAELPARLTEAQAVERDRQVLEGSHAVRHESWCDDAGGQPRLFETLRAPFFDPYGNRLGMVGIARDITVERRQQEVLRIAKLVYDNAMEGIVIMLPDSRLQAANAAFCAITGYREEELIGKKAGRLPMVRHNGVLFRQIWRQLQQQGWWSGEVVGKRRDGQPLTAWLTMRMIYDSDDRLSHYVATLTDISELKEAQQQLEFLAHHDPLTGLANRILLMDTLTLAINRARRRQYALGLLFIDLDRFKEINDCYGHHCGDLVLTEVAARLRDTMRKEDLVARIGGDEFVVLMEQIADRQQLQRVVDKVLRALLAPVLFQGKKLQVEASVGTSIYPQDGESAEQLLRSADRDMYCQKQAQPGSRAGYDTGHPKNAQTDED